MTSPKNPLPIQLVDLSTLALLRFVTDCAAAVAVAASVCIWYALARWNIGGDIISRLPPPDVVAFICLGVCPVLAVFVYRGSIIAAGFLAATAVGTMSVPGVPVVASCAGAGPEDWAVYAGASLLVWSSVIALAASIVLELLAFSDPLAARIASPMRRERTLAALRGTPTRIGPALTLWCVALLVLIVDAGSLTGLFGSHSSRQVQSIWGATRTELDYLPFFFGWAAGGLGVALALSLAKRGHRRQLRAAIPPSRAPALFLRPFNVDYTQAFPDPRKRGRVTISFGNIVRWSWFRPSEWVVNPFGNVVQIEGLRKANDDHDVPYVQTIWSSGHEWQYDIVQMVERSSFVIFMTGRTPGLGWEIETLSSFEHPLNMYLAFSQAGRGNVEESMNAVTGLLDEQARSSLFGSKRRPVGLVLRDGKVRTLVTSLMATPSAFRMASMVGVEALIDLAADRPPKRVRAVERFAQQARSVVVAMLFLGVLGAVFHGNRDGMYVYQRVVEYRQYCSPGMDCSGLLPPACARSAAWDHPWHAIAGIWRRSVR